MSHRDKQFIINIQLSQLKCENPFIDDFYYTMFTAKYDMLLNKAKSLDSSPQEIVNANGFSTLISAYSHSSVNLTNKLVMNIKDWR